jgi:hypothetical protein
MSSSLLERKISINMALRPTSRHASNGDSAGYDEGTSLA